MKMTKVVLLIWIAVLIFALPSLATDRPYDKTGPSDVVKEISIFRKERDNFFKSHPRSPLKESDRLNFHQLSYYPIDLRYRFQGKIELYSIDIRAPRYYVTFLTNKGTQKRYVRYGQFRLKWNGKEYTLQIFKSILSDMLFIPFKDKTNGKETYSSGRYVDAEVLIPGYETTIDFNEAYNPSCAYNERFTCPIPPEENTLDMEVHAGEKKFRPI